MKFIPATLLVLLVSGFAQAEPPHLVDRETGKYLGNLSANQYDFQLGQQSVRALRQRIFAG